MNNFGALFGKLIASPVGNNLENREDDVRRVKGIFSNLGYYKRPVENGIIDQETDTAIHNFQKDNNLKIDGYIKPGGETEENLIKILIKNGLNAQKSISDVEKLEADSQEIKKEDKEAESSEEKSSICQNLKNEARGITNTIAKIESNITNLNKEIGRLRKEIEDSLKEYKNMAASYGRSQVPILGEQGKIGDLIDFVLNDVSVPETADVAHAYQEHEALKEENHEKIEECEKEIASLGAEIRDLQKERESIVSEMHYSGCFKPS